MKNGKGIDLISEGSSRVVIEPPDQYRVEVWSDAPESGGRLLETISRSTDHSVSCAAYQSAIRQRPGKMLVHLNGRFKMSMEKAPDPPIPERQRPPERAGRPRHFDHTMQTR